MTLSKKLLVIFSSTFLLSTNNSYAATIGKVKEAFLHGRQIFLTFHRMGKVSSDTALGRYTLNRSTDSYGKSYSTEWYIPPSVSSTSCLLSAINPSLNHNKLPSNTHHFDQFNGYWSWHVYSHHQSTSYWVEATPWHGLISASSKTRSPVISSPYFRTGVPQFLTYSTTSLSANSGTAAQVSRSLLPDSVEQWSDKKTQSNSLPVCDLILQDTHIESVCSVPDETPGAFYFQRSFIEAGHLPILGSVDVLAFMTTDKGIVMVSIATHSDDYPDYSSLVRVKNLNAHRDREDDDPDNSTGPMHSTSGHALLQQSIQTVK